MSTPATVVAFGEVLWDLLPSGPALGGAPGNFAYRVNSLGDRAVMVSRLGRDALGRQAFAQLTALGMDPVGIQWDDRRPTGTVRVTVDARGQPDFFIVPDVAYDGIEATEALLDLVRGIDCLCFGTLIQRSPTSRQTLQRLVAAAGDTFKLLDINLRKDCHSSETIAWSLAHADLLKLNETEARFLAGQFHLPSASLLELARAMMARWSLRYCVITLGEHGALALAANGEQAYEPGYPVRVVDTCGSGDAFTAGFLHALLRQQPLAECCRRGNALGALVAAQAGATTPIPPAAIETLLASGTARLRHPESDAFSR